ncbi:MAG: hypothetical protein FJ253_02500 [Phycisphaerae bacterium]|nr:hypothetical protein [Phycisphaerae bacterium]
MSRTGPESRAEWFAAVAGGMGYFRVPAIALDRRLRIRRRPFRMPRSRTINPFRSFGYLRASRTQEATDTVKFVYERQSRFDAVIDIDAIVLVAACGAAELQVDGGNFIQWGAIETRGS